jgi:hypothetical protein
MSFESASDIIVRQITDEQWCEAAIKLEQNPAMNEVEASIPRRHWSWLITRTDITGVFLKNTYYHGKLVTSSSMNVYVECLRRPTVTGSVTE